MKSECAPWRQGPMQMLNRAVTTITQQKRWTSQASIRSATNLWRPDERKPFVLLAPGGGSNPYGGF